MFEHFLIRLLNGLHRPGRPIPKGRDLVLGITETTERREPVIFREALRPMHLGIIGLSGVGKSYLLENLIRQDIDHGTGFVVFDVHGDLADNILAYLAEITQNNHELLRKVVVIEPFDTIASIGFNPLERTEGSTAHFQAQQLAHVLRSRWEAKSFGPRSEELLRNALYTLSEHNLTLLELPALLTDQNFRMKLVETLEDAAVVEYWTNRYGRQSAGMQAMYREPVLTRVSSFLSDPQIRAIVGQGRSTFSFEDAIRQGQWVVVNLSKGRLGENSAILGSLFFTKLELAVLAQARIAQEYRRLFAVYADELQNLVGTNVATLIAEARKYRVSITTGQQFWTQLSPSMRAAVLGMGARVFFRLHYHDAAELAGELHASRRGWYTEILTRLPRGEGIFRDSGGFPVPFRVIAHRPSESSGEEIESVRAHSRLLHCKGREEIEKEIAERYLKRFEPYEAMS